MPRKQEPGKFWPQVRAMIWQKAQELYPMEQAKTMGKDFKGLTATHKELREGGRKPLTKHHSFYDFQPTFYLGRCGL